ncbi:MAG: OmpA family protein [Deltaproteobacteria bacterium]|nr:OmpA family protein [Deltaproteobacteria bacterium]MCW5805986.1 OmpA family protein [Deltaproteobacteria bacterium]
MARRIVKKIEGHGHHGGAWKVAYADFVTAMMALFMVMWLLASTDANSRKEISRYFRTGILPEGDMSMNHAAQITPSVIEEAPTPPPPGKESLDASKSIGEKLGRLAALDSELAAVVRNVRVSVTPEGVLIEAVDSGKGLMFDLSSARLSEPLARFLRALAPVLVSLGKPVEINGHTDARPFAAGSHVSNWDLSYQRAAAAREILEGSGFPSKQVTGVFARGSSQLFVPDDPYAPQNRRLSFLVRTANPGDVPAPDALKSP